jgi:hypothetical protein
MATPTTEGSFTIGKIDWNEGLTQTQERAVHRHVWNGGTMGDVQKISTDLRSAGQHFQDKSIEQLSKVVDDFAHLKVIEATKGIDTMVQDQLKAAERIAEANRLQNEAKRIMQEQAKPLKMTQAQMRAILQQDTRHRHFQPDRNFPLPGSNWC